ncbi:conjugal transfer protein TrbL family protein [Staphylococcus shinii]|uniref:conjugal transfer protein TrbL family protein n=1 Tax=Staphylococcus shinii TaxID=2912228 RepID=UPI003F835B20
MKKIIGLLVTICLAYIFLLPSSADAKDNGTGVKNNNVDVSQEAFNSLPNDDELESELNESMGNESIIKQGKAKKIKKGKGGLYKTYEKDIDKLYKRIEKTSGKDRAEAMQKLVEEYNTSTNKLDVKKWDIEGHTANIFMKIGSGALGMVTKPLQTFTIKPSSILTSPSAKPLKEAFTTLTDSMVALFLIFQVLKILVLKATDIGNYGNAIYDKVSKTVVVLILVGMYDPLFRLVLNIQYLLITPIMKSIKIDNEMGSLIMLKSLIVNSDAVMIAVPVIAILMLVVTISLFYSLAYLILLYITGPVAITTMINDEMDFYSLWVRKLVSRVLTVFLQSVCIALSLATIFRITWDIQEVGTDLLLSIAYLMLALGVPKILENFGDSSGAGRTTIMAVRSMKR